MAISSVGTSGDLLPVTPQVVNKAEDNSKPLFASVLTEVSQGDEESQQSTTLDSKLTSIIEKLESIMRKWLEEEENVLDEDEYNHLINDLPNLLVSLLNQILEPLNKDAITKEINNNTNELLLPPNIVQFAKDAALILAKQMSKAAVSNEEINSTVDNVVQQLIGKLNGKQTTAQTTESGKQSDNVAILKDSVAVDQSHKSSVGNNSSNTIAIGSRTASNNNQSDSFLQQAEGSQHLLAGLKASSNQQFAIFVPIEGEGVNKEAFVKELYNVLMKSNMQNSNSTKKLTIRLFPENLGSIRIELLQKDSSIIARILTSNVKTKELMDASLPLLQHILQQNDVSIGKIETSQTFSFFQDKNKEERKEQAKDEEKQNEAPPSVSFEELLLERVE